MGQRQTAQAIIRDTIDQCATHSYCNRPFLKFFEECKRQPKRPKIPSSKATSNVLALLGIHSGPVPLSLVLHYMHHLFLWICK